MSRYRFINAERGHCPVRRLCQVLGVPASGYYAWQTGQQRAVDQQTPAWETALVKAFGVHQRRYGTRRLQVTLRENGHRVGRQRLGTAMRRRRLRALQPKVYTPRTTDSTHGLRCVPNRLLDQPKPTQANPGQPGVGLRHHVPTPGQRQLGRTRQGLFMRLSGRVHQARRGSYPVGLARGGRDAGRIGHHGLATGLFRAVAHPEPTRPL